MKPEQHKSYIDIWVLAQLGTVHHTSAQDSPWTVVWEPNVYNTLASAQQAQTFMALKSNVKYEIFHLEFPV
jgi:hypothetical protein